MRDLRNYRKGPDKQDFTVNKKEKQAEVKQIKEDIINYAITPWGKKWIY